MNKHQLTDGYYLFVYSEIDTVMNVLCASLRHDHNMSLFKKEGSKVELVRHWEFERYTGYKHHSVAFPSEENFKNFITELLNEENLELEDIVAIIGTPFGMATDISDVINQYPQIAYHAISHMYTSMMVDSEKFRKDAMIALAFDGGPDILIDHDAYKKNFFSGAIVKEGKIVSVFDIPSPGAYWAYAANHFQMPEGTLMALAYACNARTLEKFDLFPEYRRASDKLNFEKYTNNLIETIMGYKLPDDLDKIQDYDDRFSPKENKISMIMKIIQENSIKQTYQVIDQLLVQYNLNPKNTRLSLSGGFALNCPTNTDLMHHYGFKEQLCCPCVNDGGLAIGMGLHYFHFYGEYDYHFSNSYYGSQDERDVYETLKDFSTYISDISQGIEYIADDIEKEPIVWFDARAEIGPRALGHRSILANPSKEEHKDLLNQYKIREWWRPVAPIVLNEEKENWFVDCFESEYMLNNFSIKPEKAKLVPAIIHLDGTCRVQTVSSKDDKNLYDVVKRFYQKSGVPMICNTSLNDHGEPIINRIEEAMNFALRKKIGIIYINGFRISLKNHHKYTTPSYLKRKNDMFVLKEEEKVRVLKEENPYNLAKDEVLLYKYNGQLHKYSLKNEKDVAFLSKVISKIKQTSLDMMGLEYIALKSN